MGYHLKNIKKGKLGAFSKIREEYQELKDAHKQDNKVLIICEMCDLVGAIEAYAANFNLSLGDIIKMKNSTKESFQEGKR
jgi:phosphoribosyl-ATP pyrophosphohydrolase